LTVSTMIQGYLKVRHYKLGPMEDGKYAVGQSKNTKHTFSSLRELVNKYSGKSKGNIVQVRI
jgi:hypothetical protein